MEYLPLPSLWGYFLPSQDLFQQQEQLVLSEGGAGEVGEFSSSFDVGG